MRNDTVRDYMLTLEFDCGRKLTIKNIKGMENAQSLVRFYMGKANRAKLGYGNPIYMHIC